MPSALANFWIKDENYEDNIAYTWSKFFSFIHTSIQLLAILNFYVQRMHLLVY